MNTALLIKSTSIRRRLAQALEEVGCRSYECLGIDDLLRKCRQSKTDAILLERQGNSMKDCIQALRFQFGDSIAIVVLGERAADVIVDALLAGASDYANVHDLPQDVASRVVASSTRRRRAEDKTLLHAQGCVLDMTSRTLALHNNTVKLTPREFALAWLLFEKAGSIVSTHNIAKAVWGRDVEIAKRTIEQHIHKLRRKLSFDGTNYPHISAHYGVGYMLHAGAIADQTN